MSKKLLQIQSTIEKVETRKDNTLKITVSTQELAPESEEPIFRLRNKIGWFVFKEEAIKEEDLNLPEIKPEFKNEKSPSQRLRNVIFIWWEQKGKNGNFDDFYKKIMNNQIEQIKEKLN